MASTYAPSPVNSGLSVGQRERFCDACLRQVELKAMADRVLAMRASLHAAMIEKKAPGDWSFILKQIGMFSYTGGLGGGPAVTSHCHVMLTC